MFVSGGPCLTVRVLYVEGPLRAPVDKALVREVRELIRAWRAPLRSGLTPSIPN